MADEHYRQNAQRMRERYNNSKRVRVFQKGDVVSLRIPRIDRAATDLHRLPCVVRERLGKKHFLYRLQCEHGILNTCYPGGDLEAHTGNVNLTSNSTEKLSLREAAKKANPCNTYYGNSCTCKGDCSTLKCSCLKAQQPCSTRCHSGRSCKNNRDCVPTSSTNASISTRRKKQAKSSTIEPIALQPSTDPPLIFPITPPPSAKDAPPADRFDNKISEESVASAVKNPPRQRRTLMKNSSKIVDSPPDTVDVDDVSPPPTKWWLKEFSLTEKDKMSLMNGDWLNDLHIYAAHRLLKADFPQVGSLQSTLLGSQLKFQVMPARSVQILNFCSHWACVSTIDCNPGHVMVFDSLYSAAPSALVKQLCCLMKTKEKQLKIDMMTMQSQSGESDCGCFAIACATALCYGQNPSCLKWSQQSMRQHLLAAFAKRKMSPFPAEEITTTSCIKKTITVPVYCICRQPHNRKGMLQCTSCSEWYHKKCLNIPASAFKKNSLWTCSMC